MHAPRSRLVAVRDKRALGKTTMIARPQHLTSASTGALHPDREEFFRGHALSGSSMRAARGGLGDSDDGYLSAPRTMTSAHTAGFSFGSPSPHYEESLRFRNGVPKKFYDKEPLGRMPGY